MLTLLCLAIIGFFKSRSKSEPTEQKEITITQRMGCDLLIVGAGVTGAAAAFVAAKYTNLKRIIIIESLSAAGLVNSSHESNAQTLHEGDTETNYVLKKALKVKFAAKLLRGYIFKKIAKGLYEVMPGMVIAVGKQECDVLRARHAEFRDDYPELQLMYGVPNQPDATTELLIGDVAPAVMSGRKKIKRDDICALYTPNRVCVNYQQLAREFLADAEAVEDKTVKVYYDAGLETITKTDEGYTIVTKNGFEIKASTVEFAAGAYSLSFAHRLGYALRKGILNVAGNFYWIGRKLFAKVYTIQFPNIPFAAFHIDHNLMTGDSQLGPTTQIILEMIRRRPDTIGDYLQTPLFTTWDGWKAFYRTIKHNHLLWYGLKNIIFMIPAIGTYLVLREARKIIPDLKYFEIKIIYGHGGSRPQEIDLDAINPLIMGDSNVIGWRIIFNTTPSPGASVSLKNALRDIRRIVEFFEGKYEFYLEKFKADFDITDEDIEKAYAK